MLEQGSVRLHRLRFGDDLLCKREATIADIDTWAGYEFGDGHLGEPAEGAGGICCGALSGLPIPGAAGGFNDLVHPLMADVERLGDLAKGRSGEVEPADRVVVVGLGKLGASLPVQPAGTGLSCAA